MLGASAEKDKLLGTATKEGENIQTQAQTPGKTEQTAEKAKPSQGVDASSDSVDDDSYDNESSSRSDLDASRASSGSVTRPNKSGISNKLPLGKPKKPSSCCATQ